MKKNTIAQKIAAAVVASALVATPAVALAAPVAVAYAPYGYTAVYDDQLDGYYNYFVDDYDVQTPYATPREQLRAIVVSLVDAGFGPREVYIEEVLPFAQYNRRFVEVTFWAYGTCYDYTVEAATGNIVSVYVS
jgi:hypothetical protein